MWENNTNFPPRSYSSSFYIDALAEEEKAVVPSNAEVRKTHLFDCFISTSSDKDVEVADLWKRQKKTVRSPSPHNAFRRWRIKTNLKAAEKHGINGSKMTISSKSDEEMSLLKFLAINALDLSAPASDVLLKSRIGSWFQLSGHPDSLAPAGPGTVWKKRSPNSDDTERIVYEEVSRDPELCDIIPKYYREVEYQGEKFIELQDLLHGFKDPFVIDIKMGTRTFLESEVKKSCARRDLYQKMIAIDPRSPTEEEHRCQAVTKLRYMQFRERQSSSCRLGFRIEAMKRRGSAPVTDLKTVKDSEEVSETLDRFLGGREDVKRRLLTRLCDVRSKIENSEYFKRREIVGSSLFIVYDDHKVGAWLIDFAKTNKLAEGQRVDHRTAWVQGNHEEGLLFGFDRLISMIENIKNPPLDASKEHFRQSVPAVSVKS
ncbi:unnamed protein product [Phaedon cochleariae]|uniref:Kinase n=1 Tax=Phaedon cochleariae TaxID=80249 RepID=A0A9P0DR85_PHACE|nr:unnamed protein product [Phaedon cochleariae]